MAKTTVSSTRAAAPPVQPLAAPKGFFASPYAVMLVLMALAFILYGNTIGHDYALDDAIVITQNSYTQKGFAGLGEIFSSDAFEAFFKAKKDLVAGGRYRPLSIATFAVEHELFGASPHVSHFVNVFLYGLLGIVLFYGLRTMLREEDAKSPWHSSFAFLATLLFLVHPIHTEVVANIKGRDELLALLFSLLGLWRLLCYAKTGSVLELAIAFGAFFLGALSKETALPFLAFVPMSLWMMGEKSPGKHLMALAPVALAVVLYMVLRFQFAGGFSPGKSNEILNDPFLHATYAEQIATAAKTVVLYLGKLFVPATLSHDYYFNQVPVVGLGDPLALLGFALTAGGLVLGVYLLGKKSLVGYGLLFFFLSFSIVSNVVFPIGTTMGERFMFVPSLGFLIAVLAALQKGLSSMKMDRQKALLYGCIGVSLIFGIRTIARNPVWENDFVLFTTDVENSPNSAKMQTAAGGVLVDEAIKPGNEAKKMAYLGRAIPHLQQAVKIYPQHGTAWLILGNAQFNSGNYAEALKAYQQVIAHRPGMVEAHKNAGLAALNAKQYPIAESQFNEYLGKKPDDMDAWLKRGDNFEAWGRAQDAVQAYNRVLQSDPKNHIALGKIGMVYGKLLQDYPQAISYLERAIALNPKEEMHHENIGIAYAMKGDHVSALAAFNRGLGHFPNSPKLLRNIGITYIQMGDTVTAQQYFSRAGQ